MFETESDVICGTTAWAVTKSRQDDRQQYTFEGRIERKKILKKKHWIKKGDKLTDSDRAFGHWPLLCNDQGGVCSGRQNQTFDKQRTHDACHDSSVSKASGKMGT